jgi:hypothetical protein
VQNESQIHCQDGNSDISSLQGLSVQREEKKIEKKDAGSKGELFFSA